MEGMGEGELNFPLLKSVKRQKAPLGRSVSTNFVADCSYSLLVCTSRRMSVGQAYAVVINKFYRIDRFPVSMAMEVSAPNTAVRVSWTCDRSMEPKLWSIGEENAKLNVGFLWCEMNPRFDFREKKQGFNGKKPRTDTHFRQTYRVT